MQNDLKFGDQTQKPVFTIKLSYSSKNKDIHCTNTCDFKCLKVLVVSSLLTIFVSLTTWGVLKISDEYYKGYSYSYSNEPKNDSSVDNNSSSFDNLYVSRIYWLAQSPTSRLDTLHTPVSLIIIHHTATQSCLTSAECKLQTRIIQAFHIENRHWSDIGYNFLIGGDGKIYEGRGWTSQGAHTLYYNKMSFGIGFIGTFTNYVPGKYQIDALEVLIEKGVQLGYIATDYIIVGARQLSSTESPGKSFYELIKTWNHWSEKII
ncbi:unnamed protein product [Diabrotica balteata]|uniref:Uncharacterized protein n=1 Tax=Diabrotica balteata TaxID=107213 RepID=A0A9N9TBP9_DIABA|nr:unnamed protein product [Diabrotica balteata]